MGSHWPMFCILHCIVLHAQDFPHLVHELELGIRNHQFPPLAGPLPAAITSFTCRPYSPGASLTICCAPWTAIPRFQANMHIGRKLSHKQIGHFNTMWTCSKCGEEIQDQFDSCWKCAGQPDRIGLPCPAMQSRAMLLLVKICIVSAPLLILGPTRVMGLDGWLEPVR